MNFNLSKIKDASILLSTTIGYLICFTGVLMIYQKEIPAPYYLIGIPIILIYYYLVQQHCYHAVLYFLLHMIVLIPILIIPFPYPEYRYLYLILLCFEIIQAFFIKHRTDKNDYQDIPWYIFIGTCLVFMIIFGSNYAVFTTFLYYLGIGLILLYFIRFFSNGLIRLLSSSANTTSVPIRKILFNNTYVFVLFLFIFVVIAVAIKHSTLIDSIQALGQTLAKGIGLIFHFFFYIITLIKAFFAQDSQTEETQAAEENIEQVLSELKEPTLIARIVEGTFTIACICLFIYCTYLIIRMLINLFAKHYIQDSDNVIQLTKPNETSATQENKSSILKRIREVFQKDNASKIRYGYRLKINSYKSFSPNKSHTPQELAEQVEIHYQDNIDELTRIYEKARYSNEEITYEDVQKGGIL